MVTVWCPDWPVVAAGIPGNVPAVVLHANHVVARSPAAAAEGVAIGQRRRDAQRLCPEVLLLDHEPDRDARAFEPILRAVGELAPRLEVVEPGWLCLAARGPSRYFGGDETLAQRLEEVTRSQVGIADGRFASGIAARMAAQAPVVVAPGGTRRFTAPLPVAWLQHLGEATPDLVRLLGRLGLVRLGDLAALTPGDVLARFGTPGRHAHRLASGLDGRLVDGDAPPPQRGIEQTFEDPVTQLTPVLFTAKHLAGLLADDLAANGQVCTRLVVTLETDHGERTERAWYRAAGMSMLAMVDRVRWQLAAWTTAGDLTAGVVMVRLAPDEVRQDDGEQLGLWGGRSDADERALRAITRLSGMVGEEAVLVPAWQGGRLPGDRYRWVPATATDLTDTTRLRPPTGEGPWPGSLPAPSPSIVLPEPLPAQLIGADGQPVQVTGRGELSAHPVTVAIATGRPVEIVAWAGPWPLDEHWWDPVATRRAARLQVVTAAGDAHLLLAEHRAWWCTATYA
jgi:protein ImuB